VVPKWCHNPLEVALSKQSEDQAVNADQHHEVAPTLYVPIPDFSPKTLSLFMHATPTCLKSPDFGLLPSTCFYCCLFPSSLVYLCQLWSISVDWCLFPGILLPVSRNSVAFAFHVCYACYARCYIQLHQIMSSTNNYNSRLERLASASPRTKVALIRSLLPGIELALNSGQRLKDIWEELNNEGLEMSYQGFHKTVQRARRSRKLTTASDWGKQDNTWGRQRQGDAKVETKVETVGGRDPLANLKRLEENMPGFHWPGTQSLQRLVYGTEESKEKE
jgi:hypothetical protein